MTDTHEVFIRTGMAAGYQHGLQGAARMARDMSDKMLEGKLPHVGGAAALQLFATMLDRIIDADAAE
jgi:hypothetical protein